MEEMSERELEQLRRLDVLRKQVQVILKSHIQLLFVVFALFLCGILTLIYLRVTLASNRYVARLSLHYYPKQPGKIRPYEEKFMLQMFNRSTLKQRFAQALKKGEIGNMRPSGQISVQVEKKRKTTNNFMIVLYARTNEEAVTFINAFARFCLQEYAERRTEDLKNWGQVLTRKKQDVFKQIQKLNDEKSKLISPLHVISPAKDYERLRLSLSAHSTARAKLNFSLMHLKTRAARLQSELKQINPTLLEQKKTIREQLAELKQLEKEISIAQELYTEENPKLMTLLSREKALREKFEAFLKSCGLMADDTRALENAERIHTELKAVQAEVTAKEEELKALDEEIASSRETFETLTKVLPRYQELNQQTGSLRDSLQKLDESLADINYLLVLIKDDLFVTEQAVTAVGQKPFRKKNLAIAAFAAASLTGVTMMLLVLLDLLFGNVVSEHEMTLHSELQYLGKLPVSGKMFRSEIAKDVILNTVCHHLQSAMENIPVVLAGALPGAKLLPEFFSAVEWTYAMSGKKVLFLDVVLAGNAEPDLPMEDTGIVAYSGNKGVLPIASKKFIAPAELELLREDLVTLRKTYDVIFFRHYFSLRHDRLFLEQIIPLCNGLLIAVGLSATSRKSLRTLAELQRMTGLKVMTILTDRIAAHFSKIVDMENEI